MNSLTLQKLFNTRFDELYGRLIKGECLKDNEYQAILAIGIFLVNHEDSILERLGYRLFLLYSKKTNDYKPLYEISLNMGLIPVAQFIINKMGYDGIYGNIYTTINSINNRYYRYNDSYRTLGQLKLFEESTRLESKYQAIVAPTSYGKTESILTLIERNKGKNICVLTPTKSLLAQTKKRVLNHLGNIKIVTHPDMYSENNENILGILTQERLLKLLQNNPLLKFDILIVDEAHNLLEPYSGGSMRSLILAFVIVICYNRNNNLYVKYFTPFLKSKDSLLLKYIPKKIDFYKVTENVKSELYYFYNCNSKEKFIIDQYYSKKVLLPIKYDKKFNDVDIVLQNSVNKNIVYLNSPANIESYAIELAMSLDNIDNDRLKKAIKDIREYIHPKYKLASCLEKGVIYHHGSIPESIRYFIEDLYSGIDECKFIVANSTLLEGVNFPATRLFILDIKKGNKYLSATAFKNLAGRICRFSEIFNANNENLDYLLPEIHIVKGRYVSSNANIISFINKAKMLVKSELEIKDDIENPLLIKTRASEDLQNDADIFLQNISAADNIDCKMNMKAKTEIGRLCYAHYVNIFNIQSNEIDMELELSWLDSADNVDAVFILLNQLFFSRMADDIKNIDKLKRLKEEKAIRFYKMLINWRINNVPMKNMINNIVEYWNKLDKENSRWVYVGKWGDKEREGHKKYWTDISAKDEYTKINLAILRLKEEYDFIDVEIMKYIEIIFYLKLIDEELYKKIKYGTDDDEVITLLKCGISSNLTYLLKKKYPSYIQVNKYDKSVILKKELVEEMKKNNENGILIAEVKLNIQE